MNVIDRKSDNEVHAAGRPVMPVHFCCHAPEAKSVQLVGDFNHWKPFPMQPRGDGWWFAQVMLVRGHHQYRFLVDGQPVLDPHAMGKTRNQSNEEVSVVAAG
jgi:1,4-alpha-glucan branching enzyme